MKKIEMLTSMDLEEIKSHKNADLVKFYNDYLNKLITNRIRKNIVFSNYGKSINDIEEYIYMSEEEITSMVISPGDLLLYYDNSSYIRSHKDYSCDLSGEVIYLNELYILYKPFIENISKKIVYISKKLYRFKEGYSDFIPKTLNTFEALLLQLGEENSITEYKYKNIPLDDIQSRLGESIDFYMVRK